MTGAGMKRIGFLRDAADDSSVGTVALRQNAVMRQDAGHAS
jgi:hypothetical protein